MKFYEVLILTNILGIDYLSISLIFYFLWGGGWELRHIIDNNGVEYKKKKDWYIDKGIKHALSILFELSKYNSLKLQAILKAMPFIEKKEELIIWILQMEKL